MIPRIIRPGEPGYRRCKVSVMDTTDPEITFDSEGVCSHVAGFRDQVLPQWNPAGDPAALEAVFARIKESGRHKEYDCILGLSGGLDSSFVAYLARQHGLRPLVVHTDTGWNSEIAVRNIENVVKGCGFDLHTHVVDWDEMQDLQRAFFRAAVPNQDIPQDHAIFAAFYGFAARNGIQWVLGGHNFATESILPRAWGYGAGDAAHLRAIHRRFGERPLKAFPLMGKVKYGLEFKLLRRLKVVKPLNYVRYVRTEAVHILKQEFGWAEYGAKHYESRFTRFFQGWYLPAKFGYDKRLAHLSSLILSGQMSRDDALAALDRQHYSTEEIEVDKTFMRKKLKVGVEAFEGLMNLEPRSHFDYPTQKWLGDLLLRCGRLIGR